MAAISIRIGQRRRWKISGLCYNFLYFFLFSYLIHAYPILFPSLMHSLYCSLSLLCKDDSSITRHDSLCSHIDKPLCFSWVTLPSRWLVCTHCDSYPVVPCTIDGCVPKTQPWLPHVYKPPARDSQAPSLSSLFNPICSVPLASLSRLLTKSYTSEPIAHPVQHTSGPLDHRCLSGILDLAYLL